jgi:hypothetical protein
MCRVTITQYANCEKEVSVTVICYERELSYTGHNLTLLLLCEFIDICLTHRQIGNPSCPHELVEYETSPSRFCQCKWNSNPCRRKDKKDQWYFEKAPALKSEEEHATQEKAEKDCEGWKGKGKAAEIAPVVDVMDEAMS